MVYYRVKEKYDNLNLYKIKNNTLVNQGDILVGEELYTTKEWNNLKKLYKFGCNPDGCVERVEIPKNKIYFFFGARFEYKGV